ncbi:hypothetical protein [Bradyrhizobium roseum]|uniref:hypothetical protein n=1 Tax=Bradyrhizobium roseum TaxID=3056648 RepID=UPI0026294778|nr:hypothetical protein [Bradyrhizobium roseus]WKA25929.1 hypothetical protein QUH67_20125 [Bradyrhizobium roseus]
MSIRSVKFVPAVFAGVVAGISLATTTDLQAQLLTTSAEAAIQAPQVAADSCLSAPKGATPPGSHWYYRLDRVTKRQCWYLREESDSADDKFARAAPPASAPATASAADEPTPQQRTASRKSTSDKSLSDARAEWQPRIEANPPARIERTAATAAPAPIVSSSPRAATPNVLAPAPLSSMRWNEATPTTRASVNPTDIQLAAANAPAAQLQQAEEVQQPAVEQYVPADAAPAKPTASLQKLLGVMAAALALAGLTVSAIVRIGRIRARRAMRRKRRAMWDAAKPANNNAKAKRRAPQPQAQPQPVFRDENAVLRRAAAADAPQPRMASPTRPPRERPQQERPYAPQERRHAPQDRMPQERMPQARQPQDRVPQDRDRERQVTEMLSRLARTAHS